MPLLPPHMMLLLMPLLSPAALVGSRGRAAPQGLLLPLLLIPLMAPSALGGSGGMNPSQGLMLPLLMMPLMAPCALGGSRGRSALQPPGLCDHAANKQLCLPPEYSKFELPFADSVNVVEIGIDILDVLRINDKVRSVVLFIEFYWSYFLLNFSLVDTSDWRKFHP